MPHNQTQARGTEDGQMVNFGWVCKSYFQELFFFKANLEKKSRFSFSRSRCRRFPGALTWNSLMGGGKTEPKLKESPKTYQKMIFFTEKKEMQCFPERWTQILGLLMGAWSSNVCRRGTRRKTPRVKRVVGKTFAFYLLKSFCI